MLWTCDSFMFKSLCRLTISVAGLTLKMCSYNVARIMEAGNLTVEHPTSYWKIWVRFPSCSCDSFDLRQSYLIEDRRFDFGKRNLSFLSSDQRNDDDSQEK